MRARCVGVVVSFAHPRPSLQLENGLDYLDTKLPTIRGRPAFRELAANLKPGITVSLVSLPLSISLAIASGASPVQGIITACWAGLVSALFGGSHYNVVGPTGECRRAENPALAHEGARREA